MRVVDVGEKGKFSHKWILPDEEKECYVSAIRRCSRLRKSYMQSVVEEEDDEPIRKNSFWLIRFRQVASICKSKVFIILILVNCVYYLYPSPMIKTPKDSMSELSG